MFRFILLVLLGRIRLRRGPKELRSMLPCQLSEKEAMPSYERRKATNGLLDSQWLLVELLCRATY